MNYTTSDNASIYSSVSSNLEPRTSRECVTPRSAYTADLYELPVNRLKPKPYKKNSSQRSITCASAHSLSLIPEKQPVKQDFGPSLTPYQVQRNQMRTSFQFANGENFTPKQKTPRAPSLQQRHSLPRSASCSNFHMAPPSGMIRPSPMLHRKRSSLANTSTLPLAHGKRGLPKSASTSRLSSVPLQTINKPPTWVHNATNESKASLQSFNKTTSNSSSFSSRAQVVSSNTSTSNSSNSLRSENIVSSNTSSGTSEGDDSRTAMPMVLPKKTSSETTTTVFGSISTIQANEGGLEPRSEQGKMIQHRSGSPRKIASIDRSVISMQAENKEGKGVKRSGSKFGSFFKKLLPFKKKKQSGSTLESTPSKALASKSKVTMAAPEKRDNGRKIMEGDVPWKSKDADDSAVPLRGNETEIDMDDFDVNDEDDDDMLMDIDLVFDSLLLKNSRPTPNPIIIGDEEHKTNVRNEKSDTPKSAETQSPEDEPMIDYDLLAEFSKLGKYIIDENSDVANKRLVPPPRSLKRPQLPNKDSAVGFYNQHAGRNPRQMRFGDRLMQNLHRDWETVHVNCKMQSTSSGRSVKDGCTSIRFANAIYVNDTYSPAEYERSDKKFIKNRRRMMQMQNMAYIKAVKVELNEYKRRDMVVHVDSVSNTHYFI